MRLIQVSGLEDPALDVFTKLSEVQLKRYYEPHGGLFIAESPKVVLRALDAGCRPVSLLVEDRHVRGEAAGVLARIGESEAEIPVYTGPYELLTRLTGYALTRGVLCAMRRPPLRDARQLLGGIDGQTRDDRNRPRRIAVLENVVNPANVGAIFRNAAALGMDAVLLTDGCSDPLYRRTIGDLDLGGTDRAAVILGAEGDGLLPETIAAADTVVRIPMQRGVDSLNVAAASAVAFYLIGGKDSLAEKKPLP